MITEKEANILVSQNLDRQYENVDVTLERADQAIRFAAKHGFRAAYLQFNKKQKLRQKALDTIRQHGFKCFTHFNSIGNIYTLKISW